MATTVTFAGNPAEHPDPTSARVAEPLVNLRALRRGRVPRGDAEWVSGNATQYVSKFFGTAVSCGQNSRGLAGPIAVGAVAVVESWSGNEIGAAHSKNVGEYDNVLVGTEVPLTHGPARTENTGCLTALAGCARGSR